MWPWPARGAGAREPRLSFRFVSSLCLVLVGMCPSWRGQEGQHLCRAREVSLNDIVKTCFSHLNMDEVVKAWALPALKTLDGNEESDAHDCAS